MQGRKDLRVDAVDGGDDMCGIQVIILKQILPDVVAYNKGVFSPVGKAFQDGAESENAVAGRHKTKSEFFLQRTADKSGNSRVSMDDVEILFSEKRGKTASGGKERAGRFFVKR